MCVSVKSAYVDMRLKFLLTEVRNEKSRPVSLHFSRALLNVTYVSRIDFIKAFTQNKKEVLECPFHDADVINLFLNIKRRLNVNDPLINAN